MKTENLDDASSFGSRRLRKFRKFKKERRHSPSNRPVK